MSQKRPEGSAVGDLQERRDRQLLERVTHRDENAFAELFKRYGAAALGLARRVLASEGLAEEVVQEVFLAVWNRAAAYDPARGSVRAWILTQIHHRAVDVVRREESERRRTTSDFVPVDQERVPDDVIEETWIDGRRQQVRKALSLLPPEQREVLELTYFGGMTQVQAAEKLRAPLGTVKSRTVGAMRRLRDALVETDH